ncbi:Aste57867_3829 [Aphanomyces stellatus]|uniref:Aste57867_3829 protein n=1 Tax=Aphanomyces stellatus TaxID=120398 RepID=A0A485KCV1_9STRA|nr:hypothetical protein As57867_003818 [Aphanomyces stellatus]VFT80977.1 Aste57867_3829 [Aphanomyces stellatus]
MISKSALAAIILAMASTVDATGYKNVVYYMEWATYARNFNIFDLDWSKITHVNYAFGKPAPDGTVGLYDAWSAVEKRFPDHGDSWNDPPTSAFGQFGQANKLKKQFRGTKFGLSIGGWTLSDQFSNIAASETTRRTFAKSAVQLMLDLGLDFIDIDWEYPVEGGNDVPATIPHRPDDIQNYVALLSAIRDEFKNVPFGAELSVASPAGSPIYRHWDFAAICGQLDHINVMTYDLAGSWSTYTDHQANLYADPNHPKGLVYSVDGAIQDYLKGGCPANKIVMGIPAYGRSFENTNGLYGNFTAPTKGSWVTGSDGAGIWDYKALPQAGATEVYDAKLGAAYSYDPASKTWISYDSPQSMAQKLDYIKKYNLGGTMFWSGDADHPTSHSRSLINQAYTFFGKDNMAFYNNNVNYPTSKYDNIRSGSAPSPSSSAPPSTSSPPATTPAPSSASPATPAPSTSAPVTSAPSTAAPVTPVPSTLAPVPTDAPVTPSPSAGGQCDGKTGGVCYWPFNKQTLPFSQSDCVKFTEFVWCP